MILHLRNYANGSSTGQQATNIVKMTGMSTGRIWYLPAGPHDIYTAREGMTFKRPGDAAATTFADFAADTTHTEFDVDLREQPSPTPSVELVVNGHDLPSLLWGFGYGFALVGTWFVVGFIARQFFFMSTKKVGEL